MKDYKKIFKGKKITIMGLGLLGGATNDAIFLARCGAELTITDLKTEKELKLSVQKLKKFKNIKYVLGRHDLNDFKNADMILQPGNVPENSIYLKEAKKNNIPIYVSESLFAKYATQVMMIGVTGTRGKSMTTNLIYEILSQNIKDRKVYLGGNVRSVSTLSLLAKVKENDIVVLELDSWALHGLGDICVSPQISVFTSFMPDHMNYYGGSMEKYFNDKANIFKFQKKPARNASSIADAGGDDILIIRPGMRRYIKKKDVKGKLLIVDPKKVNNWKFIVPGIYQRENLACAVEVAKIFGISESKIKTAVTKFKGLEGRLQLLRNYKGIKIYNDNNATTPEATIAGLEALKEQKKNIILICGGSDKGLQLDNFVKAINKYCKALVLIPGSGTDKLITNYKLLITYEVTKNLKDAVRSALGKASRGLPAQAGDTILFSPAFASFGMFNNEYERNDLFVKIIKSLK
jgi:UDP-N-acetylmuramoylalanine--D-glutamate ligase